MGLRQGGRSALQVDGEQASTSVTRFPVNDYLRGRMGVFDSVYPVERIKINGHDLCSQLVATDFALRRGQDVGADAHVLLVLNIS